MACTVICKGISRPSFSCRRSNLIPTIEPGDDLLWALASVMWPMISEFRGTTIWPCTNKSVTVLASILSFALHFLTSSFIDNSTERTVPGTGLSGAGAAAVGTCAHDIAVKTNIPGASKESFLMSFNPRRTADRQCPSYDRQVSSIYLNAVISERMDQGLASHNRLMPILLFPRHSSNIRMLLEEEEICTP
jgi:hypothetical protein